MITFDGIEENLKFIIIETKQQVEATLEFCDQPQKTRFDKIYSRDDYIDNLKNIIEKKCYSQINQTQISKEELNALRAVQIITINLERIADYCVNIILQFRFISARKILDKLDYHALFETIIPRIDDIFESFQSRDLSGALAICKAEHVLDEQYKSRFDKIMSALKTGKNVEDLITALFIFRYLERIGDALLNVGEALLLAMIGEKIKIHQFKSLQKNLIDAGLSDKFDTMNFKSFLGTRSGCRISRVEQPLPLETQTIETIFKEGNIRKIRAEKENFERWNKQFPGLVPHVYNYFEQDDTASILVEFLTGFTLDEIILQASRTDLEQAHQSLVATVRKIWSQTRQTSPLVTNYIQQIKERFNHICRVHPEFCLRELFHEERKGQTPEEILDSLVRLETSLSAPFTVSIHGDFNNSNIIINTINNTTHYIDLSRSKQFDYVQDISVFLLSNFRLPVFDTQSRDRINWTIRNFFEFSLNTARQWQDHNFQARMALALARSFYTSTRFELNPQFSAELFSRSRQLFERVLNHHDSGLDWSEFMFPETILYY